MWKSIADLLKMNYWTHHSDAPAKANPSPKFRAKLHCYICGYDWTPRRDKFPARCPRCQKRRYWINPNQVDLPLNHPELKYAPPEHTP